MSYLLVGMVVAYVLVTIGLVTLLMYYGSLAYQCDALVGFWCHTDWQCADVDGIAANSGTYDAAGNLIPGDQISCHLKSLYGVEPGEGCPGYVPREKNPCMTLKSPDADRNDPNSYTGDVLPTTFPCVNDINDPNYNPDNGLCLGQFNQVSNIPGVINNSNSNNGSPDTRQYGLGAPPTTPFGCACYFGTNVIANSGTPSAPTPITADDAENGGQYNISGMACSQIINKYAPVE